VIERKVAIITDAGADLPASKELQTKFGIDPIIQVPLSINFGNDSYQTGTDLNNQKFKELIQQTGLIPKTSAFGEDYFCDIYKKHISQGLDIISIHIGENMSSTIISAKKAANNFDSHRITVWDSGTISMAQGFQAIMAQKAATAGETQETILKTLDSLKERTTLRAVVSNIPYLRSSGRVSHLQAIFGTILNIVPILQIDHNKIITADKVRTSRKTIDWMVDYINEGKEPQHIAIVDFDASNIADELKNRLISDASIPTEKIYRGDLGPVTGSHGGPGAWAMITVREK